MAHPTFGGTWLVSISGSPIESVLKLEESLMKFEEVDSGMFEEFNSLSDELDTALRKSVYISRRSSGMS